MKLSARSRAIIIFLAIVGVLLGCSSSNPVSLPADVAADLVPVEMVSDGVLDTKETLDLALDLGPDEEVACEPACGSLLCGPDPVCGVECGPCPSGQKCVDGLCASTCTDTCESLGCTCGVVCGESCGTCAHNECILNCHCLCTPECGERKCGVDGCGGICGTCPEGQACLGDGQCHEPSPCKVEECPVHPGAAEWTVSCNAKDHCEYTLVGGDPHDVEIWVPAGSFEMGAPDGDYLAAEDARPKHVVTFAKGYFVDKYETTYAQFLRCRDDGVCADPTGCGDQTKEDCEWASGYSPFWDKEKADVIPGNENRPVIGTTPFMANQYCNWRGKYIANEAEWERAARGSASFLYPWGNSPEPTCETIGIGTCKSKYVLDVGSFPEDMSPVGAMDMAGNAAEMVADVWQHDYGYFGAPTDGSSWGGYPNTASSGYVPRLVRGQPIGQDGVKAVGLYFRQNDGGYFNREKGFRCTREPE